jgi:hypothetical protein
VAGAEAAAAGRSVEEAARAAEAPARTAEAPTSAAEASGSAATAMTGATTAPAKPLRKRKRGFSTLRYAVAPPDVPVSRGRSSVFYLCVRRVAPTVPALVPAKALRSDASVHMRWRSSRVPRVTGSAAVKTEPPRGTDVAAGSRQEVAAATAVMTTVTTVPTVQPLPVPAAGGQADVVEIPDDDAPPPGWG